MKNKLLSILMIVSIIIATLPAIPVFASQVWDGDTKSEPIQDNGIYQISNGAELAWFADYINGLVAADTGLVKIDAVLTDDIDLGGNEWTPISLATYVVDAYAGTFDGQNHSVTNLKINATKANYGLFSTVNTGTIKNLRVEGNITSNNVVGGIVGKLQTGTIENCSFSGSVTTTGTSTKGYVGGIAGTVAAANATIKGCANNANIKGVYAGGIVGYNKNKGIIISCYNTGDIIGTSRCAGIAGQHSSGEISYCYNIGNSTNGICGFSNATITNCYYLNDEASAPGGSATGYKKITDKATLLDNLNAGSEKLFTADSNNSNNGYPVFSWQLASTVLCVPVKTVTISGNAITGEILTAQALGDNDDGATNVTYQWSISDNNVDFNDIKDATANSFTIPDTADFAGKYIKVTVIGEENSTANSVVGAIEKSTTLIDAENADKVQAVIDKIAIENTVIKEASTINLPVQDGDCTIEWTSNNEDIITSNGVVTLPDKNIVTVKLTAKVTCGETAKIKNFNIDVWANDIDADVYLQKALDSMQWSFSQLQPVFEKDTNIIVKLNNILHSKGFDGITVTVKSTSDTNLISNNGKIIYPELDRNSFADGRQVKVFFNLTVEDKTVTYPASDIYALNIPWNTSSVRYDLEYKADNLLADVDLTNITEDLDLPSCFKGDKYSFAWITWKSSDEAYLKISNENRENGADSLYNSYVGKIYKDAQEHNITLTATVENPSTEINTVRSFDITIPAMSDDELNQSIGMMNKILECYTADKLSDSATKKPIDISAVDNDIQLVIPSKVVNADELKQINYGKYWDYWNYRFSVTSSDTNIIEINSFRANVYRPLGEDKNADKSATLTVKIESKENPNLFATKDITVTVKHLTREEINNALGLMDDAKTNYSQGILGDNSDTYSIIDNLTPFKEIVRNESEGTLDYINSVSQMKGNGIIVDELPAWDEQEDWRLFKTSNKDLISNETLILNYTPDKDTFVKINSVLTDETFGKYYTKFKSDSNYDVEALAKFKQLYKQPVSAYVMVLGNGSYNEELAVMTFSQKNALFSSSLLSFKQETDKPISVTFTLLGLDGKTLIAKTTENSFTSGATVYQVFRKLISDNNMYYSSRGSYVYSINGLSERDYGGNSGWMYTVDKIFVNSYMNAQELNGGEDIVVMYVRDYTKANLINISENNINNNTENSNITNSNSYNNENVSNSENSVKPDTPTNNKDINENSSTSSLKPHDSSQKDQSEKNTAEKSDKTSIVKNNDSATEAEVNKSDNDKADTDKSTANETEKPVLNSQDISKENNKNINTVVACSVLGIVLLVGIIIIIIKKRK